MNKKRYIPLVAIGALILSLIAVFPAFGAGDVSFIMPDEFVEGRNDGSLDNPDDLTAQTYGRQDGEIGLFIDDSSLDVPIRRVLLPTTDMTQPTHTDEGGTAILLDAATTTHSATIKARVGHDIAEDDYLVVGDNTVRKVESVTYVPPTATTAAAASTWYAVIPNAADAGDSAASLTPVAMPIMIDTTFNETTVDVTATLGAALPTSADGTNKLTLTLEGATEDLVPAVTGSTTPVPVTTSATGGVTVSLKSDSVFFQGTDNTAADITVTIAIDDNDGDTTNPTPHVVTIALQPYDDQMVDVVVDRPFGKTVAIADPVTSATSVYVINKDTDGDPVTDISGVSWSTNYGLYAIAHEAVAANVVTGGYVSNFLIADSGIGDGITAGTDEVPLRQRLTGGRRDQKTRQADALVVTTNVAAPDPGDATNTDGLTLAAITRISGNEEIVGTVAAGNYIVAWFVEPNDIVVAVRSNASSGGPLVMRETGDDTGKFALKIMAVDDQPASATADAPKFDIAATDDSGTIVPALPVEADDVIVLSGPDSSGTGSLVIETTKPSFATLSPAHNFAGKDTRPEISAQVLDDASGLNEKDIDILFEIRQGSSTTYAMLNPVKDGDYDRLSNGWAIRGRLPGTSAPTAEESKISWWIRATDKAGNIGYTDQMPTLSDGITDDACEVPREFTSVRAEVEALVSNEKCDPYVIRVDSKNPEAIRAETGRHWSPGLATGEYEDKTEYRTAKANPSSVLVVFDEHLDATSVSASDFMVGGSVPADASPYNVKVRPASRMLADGTNDPDYAGYNTDDHVAYTTAAEREKGYVFLRLASPLAPNARPTVELVGAVLDLAGNEQDTGALTATDNEVFDRVAPKITVTVDEGNRPVTNDKVNLTITSDENISQVTVKSVRLMSDDGNKDNADATGNATSGRVTHVSGSEYTAVVSVNTVGLHSIFVEAKDSSGGNKGSTGDMTGEVDVSDDTKAILFEHDEFVVPLVINPDPEAADDKKKSYSTDDMNAYLRIDFSAEGTEYYMNGDDLDTHGGVTIVSATLDGEDISGALQSAASGNVFLYRAPNGLSVGEHTLEVVAMDEAGNKHPVVEKATITIIEREPYSLKLNPGWNLISIPGEPTDPDINVVIPADRTDITSVLAYDPTVPGQWLSASRGADGMFAGTLKNIVATRGYWVETNTFTPLKVDIPKQAVGQALTLPTINLAKGWNMVPVLDVDGDFELTDEKKASYFGDLQEGWRAYTFNTITNRWEEATEAELGKGYWVYVSKTDVIVP